MSFNRTADMGVELAQSLAVKPAGTSTVGFTRPGTSFARMDVLNTDAVRLNNNIRAFVADPTFKESWNAWFAEWTRFYNKYAGPEASKFDSLSVITWSDDFAARVDQEEAQFNSFASQYNSFKGPDGRSVPKVDRLPNPPSIAGWTIPWYVWAAGGIALAGVGYLLYRNYYLPVRNTRRALDEELPQILGQIPLLGGLGKSVGKIAVAGSPARDHAPEHDPEPETFESFASRDRDAFEASRDAQARTSERESDRERSRDRYHGPMNAAEYDTDYEPEDHYTRGGHY